VGLLQIIVGASCGRSRVVRHRTCNLQGVRHVEVDS
jgi:hypothetical protein